MHKHNLVRIMALTLSLAFSSPAEATPIPSGVCYGACYQGLGSECPDAGSLESLCAQAGCGGALPGCVGDWGNCPGGYRVQCITYQQ